MIPSDSQSQIDASFFQLIHHLVTTPRDGEGSDRRGRPRETFRSLQRIAPLVGTNFPDPSEFVEVECFDLNRRGFSFFFSKWPDFATLVAGFGTPPDLMYVAARVRRTSRVLVSASGELVYVQDPERHVAFDDGSGEPARPLFLVGCQFTQRMRPPGMLG